ncbi:hypothetical protein COY33_00660 [candidate division WWE3 bacterium CG_4_10_14_0_2_um_filter_42_7]|uniref:Uncharacterized protein n=2 Tax=Katanobacteria TaxID=422282 RepID=A0A2M7TE89_UNCKA|nr:MAG: hypothetical protein COY33_00660 [candidate division WWE3 bacterium CG_4_10_14_0_2_um_filter_42_7]
MRTLSKLGRVFSPVFVFSFLLAKLSLPRLVYAIGGSENPPEISGLATLIIKIINLGLWSAAPVAAIFIIVGGIKYATATSDPKALIAAKSTIAYAIIGLIVVLLAISILKIIANLIGVTDTSFLDRIFIPGPPHGSGTGSGDVVMY